MPSKTLGALLVSLAALSSSCGGGGIFESDQPDTDYVMFAGVSEGFPELGVTDRRCSRSSVDIDMTVNVDFAALNPPTGSSRFDNFRLTHYIVTYKNLLTGSEAVNVPGGVPRPMEIHLSGLPEIVPVTFELVGAPILLADQKNEPPLNDATNFPPGGVDFLATVQVWGHPEFDPDQWTVARFPVQFNVFDSGVNDAPGCQ